MPSFLSPITLGGNYMKTVEMNNDALSDAREVKYNLFQQLMMLKQEQCACSSQWNQYKSECFDESINRVETAYHQAAQLVSYYEDALQKR